MTAQQKNIPALRFPEFQGEWESVILGDKATFSKGKGISKDDISENGATECIRYGELYTVYDEVIKEIKSRTYIETENLILSEFNDVIIPASGETKIDIATASCVQKEGVALGGDLNIIKTQIEGVFLSYYLNNKKKYDIARLAQGSSVMHLYANQLKTLNLFLPLKPEQQKIADFLSVVDKRIQQLTQKKNLLEQYKKGVIQQIFSRQIRFKDEQGNDYPEWEEKRLGDVLLSYRLGGNYSNTEYVTPYPLIKMGNISRGNIVLNKIEYIPITETLSDDDRIRYGDLFFNTRNTLDLVGKVAIWKNELEVAYYNSNLMYMKFVNNFFMNYRLNSFDGIKGLRRLATGTTSVAAIYTKDLLKLVLSMPKDVNEQQQIADFLGSIDDKVSLVNTQIKQIQDFKKGLLQQMFV